MDETEKTNYIKPYIILSDEKKKITPALNFIGRNKRRLVGLMPHFITCFIDGIKRFRISRAPTPPLPPFEPSQKQLQCRISHYFDFYPKNSEYDNFSTFHSAEDTYLNFQTSF